MSTKVKIILVMSVVVLYSWISYCIHMYHVDIDLVQENSSLKEKVSILEKRLEASNARLIEANNKLAVINYNETKGGE